MLKIAHEEGMQWNVDSEYVKLVLPNYLHWKDYFYVRKAYGTSMVACLCLK
jgi:hypothetical protein